MSVWDMLQLAIMMMTPIVLGVVFGFTWPGDWMMMASAYLGTPAMLWAGLMCVISALALLCTSPRYCPNWAKLGTFAVYTVTCVAAVALAALVCSLVIELIHHPELLRDELTGGHVGMIAALVAVTLVSLRTSDALRRRRPC